MQQNLKVDIIYYEVNTDFELEFNLCGCCGMRLLTDRTVDRKDFILSLARSVSRSKVIISIGRLFGKNGLISLVSRSIGRPLITVDNKAYGIHGDDSIEIIGGAVPLVSADGYFGGCIIESGPQTIILLGDNRSLRKTILTTLIHPYITAFAGITENISTEETEPEPAKPEISETAYEPSKEETIPDIPEEPAVIYENPVEPEPDMADKDNTEAVASDEALPDEPAQPEPESAPDFAEPEIAFIPDTKDSEKYYDIPAKSQKGFKEYPTAKKRGTKHIDIVILIMAIILLLAAAGLAYLILYIPASRGTSAMEYIKETFDSLI